MKKMFKILSAQTTLTLSLLMGILIFSTSALAQNRQQLRENLETCKQLNQNSTLNIPCEKNFKDRLATAEAPENQDQNDRTPDQPPTITGDELDELPPAAREVQVEINQTKKELENLKQKQNNQKQKKQELNKKLDEQKNNPEINKLKTKKNKKQQKVKELERKKERCKGNYIIDSYCGFLYDGELIRARRDLEKAKKELEQKQGNQEDVEKQRKTVEEDLKETNKKIEKKQKKLEKLETKKQAKIEKAEKKEERENEIAELEQQLEETQKENENMRNELNTLKATDDQIDELEQELEREEESDEELERRLEELREENETLRDEFEETRRERNDEEDEDETEVVEPEKCSGTYIKKWKKDGKRWKPVRARYTDVPCTDVPEDQKRPDEPPKCSGEYIKDWRLDNGEWKPVKENYRNVKCTDTPEDTEKPDPLSFDECKEKVTSDYTGRGALPNLDRIDDEVNEKCGEDPERNEDDMAGEVPDLDDSMPFKGFDDAIWKNAEIDRISPIKKENWAGKTMVMTIYQSEKLQEKHGRWPMIAVANQLSVTLSNHGVNHKIKFGFDPVNPKNEGKTVCGDDSSFKWWRTQVNNEKIPDVAKDDNLLLTSSNGGGCTGVGGNVSTAPGGNISPRDRLYKSGDGRYYDNISAAMHEFAHAFKMLHDPSNGHGWDKDGYWHRTPCQTRPGEKNRKGVYIEERDNDKKISELWFTKSTIELIRKNTK